MSLFWGHRRLWSQKRRKKTRPDPFCCSKALCNRILVPYQLLHVSLPCFTWFRACVLLHFSIISLTWLLPVLTVQKNWSGPDFFCSVNGPLSIEQFILFIIKLAWNNLHLILSFPSYAYRWTHFPCTSTNPAGSTHRVLQNWAVSGFKEDCIRKRFCNFRQSRRGKLHVFCTFRAAWPQQTNSNVPWWVTPNYCSTPSGKPQDGKCLI